MSKNKLHHYLTEHIWRAIRASLLLIALFIWLFQDGFGGTDYFIVMFVFLAHMCEQFHGYICCLIEKMLKWRIDFDEWE